MSEVITDMSVAFPTKQRDGGTEGEVEQVQSTTNSDSGSLTQRAARIKDELLGNDMLEQHTVHASHSSSGSSSDKVERSDEDDKHIDDNEELEERLSSSSIAHSLRHIALAFDEKSCELESLRIIQQTHEEDLSSLRAKLEATENDRQTLIAQLEESNSSYTALRRRVEALQLEIEHKDELLCFSDRIASRLFNMINNIRAEVEAAESLSPALRSLFTPPVTSPCSDTAATSSYEEETIAATSESTPIPLEELIKEIEAKYSD